MALSRSRNKQSICTSVKYDLLSVILFILLALPSASLSQPQVVSFRPYIGTKSALEADGRYLITIVPREPNRLLLVAANFSDETIVKFTELDSHCDSSRTLYGASTIQSLEDDVSIGAVSTYMLNVTFDQISVDQDKTVLYFCVRNLGVSDWVHQGNFTWLQIAVQYEPPDFLPVWLRIVFALILVFFSGLFSGLNLGLMALDPTSLKTIMKSGTKRQKWAARVIYRVRKYGNYLLCTLLLGNVLVNSCFTLLLGDLLSGPVAVAGSTLAIVIFGEIIPQAICSRHGLYIGAYTIPLTYIFMFMTFPLSFPISLILNLILGKEIGAVYKREQLLELLHVTQKDADLDDNELNIISGALRFKNKKVKDIMTKMENVFCVDIAANLDFTMIKMIYDSGFSRIPIFEGDKGKIVGVLYLRDLTFIDPEDCIAVKQVRDFYNRNVWFVWDDTSLDDLLKEFVEGTHHLAVVQTFVENEDGDNYYKLLGIVTLEDVIEEILGREIVDEYDQYADNVTMKPLGRKRVDIWEDMYTTPLITLSPPQLLAVKQFLSATEAFSEKHITKSVLHHLLQQDIIFQVSREECTDNNITLYKEGTPANYFTLVLEGRLSVAIGKDNMTFDARAFSHFGERVLLEAISSSNTSSTAEAAAYIPDFTLNPVSDCLILIITRRRYLAAYHSSQLEKETFPDSTPQPSHKDIFAEKWKAAETTDLQSSLAGHGGLSSIKRFLQTKPLERLRHYKKQPLKMDELGSTPLLNHSTPTCDNHVHSSSPVLEESAV